MQEFDLKPMVACTTTKADFVNRVEAAATAIGCDFCHSDNLRKTIEDNASRTLSCVVFDYEFAAGLEDQLVSRQARYKWSLIVAVPQGDVKASFQAAGLGAVNVIEKPLDTQELVENLRTALVSEMRVKQFLESEERRFSAPIFDCLTKREKTILRLLMDGEPNKCVAAILDIGLRTVEGDRANTMKKLEVESHVELIKLVSRLENDVFGARKRFFGSGLPQRQQQLNQPPVRECA